MKFARNLFVICCLSLSAFAGNDFEGRASVGSIQDYSGENKQEVEVEGLKFTTTQGGTDFQGVIRVSLEITTKEKVVYWGDIELTAPAYKTSSNGVDPNGILWLFEVPSAGMKRPKITGYAVEYGYKDGSEFVVLDADYDDVDSAQELADRNKESKSITVTCAQKKLDYGN